MKQFSKLFLTLLFLNISNGFSQIEFRADNSRSDSINILDYTISLDITDIPNKFIKGNCAIKFVPKKNNTTFISLDLLDFTVDSATLNNSKLKFSYDKLLLKIDFLNPLNIGDTSVLTIYYQGYPKEGKKQDNRNFGGFYFKDEYAYNIGVDLVDDPHAVGRYWFPCFDNFVERSTYSFNILTSNKNISFCNGKLIQEKIVGEKNDLIIRNWRMDEEIPTYLACVAVSKYTSVNWTHKGIYKNIPVVLAAVPADTTNLKIAFTNLDKAIDIYENLYGPYRWNKVGYSLLPIDGGAMEHATNIGYQKSIADGSLLQFGIPLLANETVMAHELAHHWWGNLVTCETQADMWLNEGWATYSEHIFTENIYGKTAYINDVKENLDLVLQSAHIKNKGYLPLSPVSSANTYDYDLIYRKSAAVAHSLRGYINNDSLFFASLKKYLNDNKFKNSNSYFFRDELTKNTGIELKDFFENWVFSAGFPHFSIDSIRISPALCGVQTCYDVYVRQKLVGTNKFYNNVPIEISFMDDKWNKISGERKISGEFSKIIIPINFNPQYITLNLDNKINHAVIDVQKTITKTGTYNFDLARVRKFNVNSITDSAFVRAEHHWAAPDKFKIQNSKLKISPNRYWKIDGIIPANFKATANLYYDGKTANSDIDHNLIGVSEDSIILLYRKNTAEDWAEYKYYAKKMGSIKTDKYGYMQLDSVFLGEYALAYGDKNVLGIDEFNIQHSTFNIFPNPASCEIFIQNNSEEKNYSITIFDINGKIIYENKNIYNSVWAIDTENFENGIYMITMESKNKILMNKKLVILH